MRGWLQLTIFASHATGSWIGAWLILSPWGLSDSSEQFVFLSGFTLGSVFGRKAARDGFREAWRDLLQRTWRLYRTHLTVFVLFGLVVSLAGASILPGEAQRLGWGPVLAHPVAALPGVLLMLQQPALMGILPVFVWCMLLLPGFAALEGRWGDRALLAPLALYACVWGLIYVAPGLGWEGGIGFNPLAWQLLFLTGAWLGRRALLHGRALPFAAGWARYVSAGAALVLAAGFALQLGWHGFVAWPSLAAAPDWLTDKKDLAPGRFLHAMALAWLIAALVPRDAAWMHRALPRWLGAIGRHSLSVFCVGLFFSWGATVAFRLAPPAMLLDPVLIGAGCIGLGLFAQWRDQRAAARVPVPA